MSSIIDIVTLIFILYSGFQGFRSKTGTQFWALVALILALWGGILFTPQFANSLTFLQDPKVRSIVAFLIIFLAIHQGIQFLASALKLNFSLLILDPILGTLFALIESSLFAGAIGYLAITFPPLRAAVEQTILLAKLSNIAGSLITILGGRGIFLG